MPIEELFSEQTFGKPSASTGVENQPDYVTARASRFVATGTIVHTAGALATSMYRLISLNPDVILHPDTAIDLQNWGFAAATIGVDADTDALLASQTISGLSDVSKPIAFGDAKWGLPLWQQVGLTERPEGKITLSIHSVANATGVGSAKFEIHWLDN